LRSTWAHNFPFAIDFAKFAGHRYKIRTAQSVITAITMQMSFLSWSLV